MNERRTSINSNLSLSKRLSLRKISSFMKQLGAQLGDEIAKQFGEERERKVERNPNELIQKFH